MFRARVSLFESVAIRASFWDFAIIRPPVANQPYRNSYTEAVPFSPMTLRINFDSYLKWSLSAQSGYRTSLDH